MKRKGYVMLSVLLAVLFALTVAPVQAGFYGSETASSLYLDFETEADLQQFDGTTYQNKPYYSYVEGEGAGDSNGCINVCFVDEHVSIGLKTSTFKPEKGKTYRLSYDAMVKAEEGAMPTKVFPILFMVGANGSFVKTGNYDTTKETVSYDETTGVYSFENTSVWKDLSGAFSTYISADGTWQKYSYEFVYEDGMFTAGSSSFVAVDNFSAFRLTLRNASENVNAVSYVDNIVLEQVAQPGVATDLSYSAGDELMDNGRKITQLYHSSVVNGVAYKTVDASGTVTDATGRGYFKTAGESGDGMYAAVSSKDGSAKFTNGAGGYPISNVHGNTLYQFTARLKAPAVTIDETLESESHYYLNSSTGAVTAKTSALTNGFIHAVPYFQLNPQNNGSAMSAQGAFTGYLDADGNYVPLTYNTEKVNSGRPTLTTDWVDYVGYVYIPATGTVAWNGSTSISIHVTEASGNGILYVDELSIKEYKGANLVPNGDFALSTVSGYNTGGSGESLVVNYKDIPMVFASNPAKTTGASKSISNGNMYVYQSAINPTTLSAPVKLVAGKTYELCVGMKIDTKDVTADLDINLTKGENTLQITDTAEPPQVTNTMNYYKYRFAATEAVAADVDVAANLNIKATANNATSGSASMWYDYINLLEIQDVYAENIAINGDLAVAENVTVSWDDVTAAESGVSHIVKIYQGEDANKALLGVYETTDTSLDFTIPASANGKKLTVEVVGYLNGAISGYTVWTTDANVVRKNKLTYDAATGAVLATSAEDTAIVLYVSYDKDTKQMIDVESVNVTNGYYSSDALPQDFETGSKINVMLWSNLTAFTPLTSAITK